MSDAGDESDSDRTDGGARAPDGGMGRLSQYFRALSDDRRRLALYYLSQQGSADLDELARHVAGREAERPPESLAEQEYERAASELYHEHLPLLSDVGLVEFDPRSKHARFREPTRTFASLLWLSRLIEGE